MGTTKAYFNDFQSILPEALPSIVIIKTNRIAALPIRAYLSPMFFPSLSRRRNHIRPLTITISIYSCNIVVTNMLVIIFYIDIQFHSKIKSISVCKIPRLDELSVLG